MFNGRLIGAGKKTAAIIKEGSQTIKISERPEIILYTIPMHLPVVPDIIICYVKDTILSFYETDGTTKIVELNNAAAIYKDGAGDNILTGNAKIKIDTVFAERFGIGFWPKIHADSDITLNWIAIKK